MNVMKGTRTRSAVLTIVGALSLAACLPQPPPPAPPGPSGPSGPVPTMTSVSPESGLMTGHEEVTITGTGFADATAVTFGGVEVTAFSIDSDTQIRADTPAHDAGAARVVVTGPGGSSTDPVDFTYTPVADLEAFVTVTGGEAEGEFTIVERIVNNGPATAPDTDATFTLEQNQAVLTSDPVVAVGTFTGGSCTESGSPTQAGTWQLACADVVLAPGEFIEVTFHVTYGPQVSFTAWSAGADQAAFDMSQSNNLTSVGGGTP